MPATDGELPARVAAEIHLLRKGRGLQASDLDSRLRKLLLMDELAGPGDAAVHRQALIAEVSRCSADLLGDYRTAIEASLALSAETKQEPLFGGRVNWLASQLGRDYRTALRRIDEAEQRLAEVIATELRRRRSRTAVAPDGWYVEELRTLLRLDTEIVESHEDRRVVSTRENLTEVKAWLDVPRDANQPGADLQAEILYGGHLLRQEQPARNRFDLIVQLPKPLQPGEEHEYGLILRMPRRMLRYPHYLLTPECQCNKFDLRIRFDLKQLPDWVRRVDRETVRMFEDVQPTGDLLVPDAAGEVHEEFRDLAMYLGYGIQWHPAA
jgi:hypothetical protein